MLLPEEQPAAQRVVEWCGWKIFSFSDCSTNYSQGTRKLTLNAQLGTSELALELIDQEHFHFHIHGATGGGGPMTNCSRNLALICSNRSSSWSSLLSASWGIGWESLFLLLHWHTQYIFIHTNWLGSAALLNFFFASALLKVWGFRWQNTRTQLLAFSIKIIWALGTFSAPPQLLQLGIRLIRLVDTQKHTMTRTAGI